MTKFLEFSNMRRRRTVASAASIAFAFVLAGQVAVAAPDCDSKQQSYSGYVVGRGEGNSYEDSKSAALADAAGFFGVQLDSSAEVNEDGNDASGVYFSSSIKTKINGVVKGAEVLSECIESGTTRLTVGIKRSMIRALLDQQAEYRLTWVKSSLAVAKTSDKVPGGMRQAAKQIFDDEKLDIEAWILLQQPKEMFKSIPEDLKRELLVVVNRTSTVGRSYQIKPNGIVAERSLPAISKIFRDRGIELVGDASGTALNWTCNIDQGVAMGSNVRFSVECSIVGEDVGIEPVSVSGIAPNQGVDAVAARLINSKLQAGH